MTNSDQQKELQLIIDECRIRGITLDDFRRSFRSVSAEQPKQWRSIPSILSMLNQENLEKLSEKIKKLLENHRLYNDKLLVIYENQDNAYLQELDQLFNKITVENKQLDNSYVADSSYILSQKDKVSLHHFRKIRDIFSKEDIDIDRLPKDAQSELNEFDRIIGVRATKLDCYDAVIFDFKENLMILQLDLISMLNAGEIDKNIEDFLKTLNSLISSNIGNTYKIDKKTNAVNLYPCITNFYKNSEGAITRLSFTTSKGVHHETLKGAATDIRKADYHIGGKAKESGNIYPYRVTKKFELDIDNKPQAFIGVKYNYFAKPGAKFLASARIFDVMNFTSYTYIISKIIENR
ncbi:hypothetical protein NQ659_07250 [Acinetobacter baumannii]|uniref:hypothetical protein n=1 Tax=Acinetobacter baumannii TaxID=470 RepID=UPI0023413402|nr:hypothetical protein [Acinetobacter baumannii]MDC4953127.1 hypothetical protein [Acinetobacter baumannii]MDC5406461.1 hypothetical protein [Acinetobacter baumannii]MDV7520448.1 hypothetical protein [Acinetobacter baumannii]MDV7555923.1 hypothetical protein [Acinetobacter baumannii]